MFGISDDPNDVCLQDRLVYTCTVPDVLTWTVGGVQLAAYIAGQASGVVGTPQDDPSRLPGIVANLTDVVGAMLTSTLTISSAGSVMNESEIRCDGLLGDSNSTVLRHKGDTIVPGYCMQGTYTVGPVLIAESNNCELRVYLEFANF